MVSFLIQAYGRVPHAVCLEIKPRQKKPCLRSFRLVLTLTELFNPRRWLESWIFRFRKQRSVHVLCTAAKTTKALSAALFSYASMRKAGFLMMRLSILMKITFLDYLPKVNNTVVNNSKQPESDNRQTSHMINKCCL